MFLSALSVRHWRVNTGGRAFPAQYRRCFLQKGWFALPMILKYGSSWRMLATKLFMCWLRFSFLQDLCCVQVAWWQSCKYTKNSILECHPLTPFSFSRIHADGCCNVALFFFVLLISHCLWIIKLFHCKLCLYESSFIQEYFRWSSAYFGWNSTHRIHHFALSKLQPYS